MAIKKGIIAVVVLLQLNVVSKTFADDTFNNLIASGKYKEAVDYADEKIGIGDRTADIWVKLAKANTEIGMHEKALACYLVSWRLNPNDYQSLLGCAKVYNNLNQSEDALNMAKKALEVNFTAEASWEYAKACIALNRSSEAKTALEKVLQADPSNSIANKELGNIYYDEKAYSKAIPLLIKLNKKSPDANVAFKIGKAYISTSKADSAVIYLKDAIVKGGNANWNLELAQSYFQLKNFKDASATFSKLPQNELSASDLYLFAISKETSQGIADAVPLYDLAIVKFGTSTSKEAIISREKSARYRIQSKSYDAALRNLLFISENDPNAAIVPEIYFLLADVYSATNNGQKAIASLEKAISLNGKNVEAYARLADLYQKNGMVEKAKKTLESMLSLSPNDPGVYLSLGQYYLSAKKYNDALGMFDKSNSLKTSAEALGGKASAEFALNQISQARSSASLALQRDGSLLEARIIMSKILLTEKNYMAAQEQLEYVIQKRNELEYLKQLSDCYIHTNNKGKLLEIDKKIVSLSSNDSESRMRLAQDAEITKNYSDALKLYKELVVLKPEDTQVLHKLYELSVATNDNYEAISYLQRYLSRSPDDAQAHGDLGDLFYSQKRNDDALNEYRTALKLNPSIKGFLKRYADLVIAKGLQDEVINALSNLITSGDADVSTYTTLGMIYEKKKMSTKAIEMYHAALQLEPSNAEVLAALAGCQASIGDVNGAIISYEQTIMMNSKAVNEYKSLGELYLRSFKQSEAINAFKKYLSKDSSDIEIIRKVGKDAYTNKDYKSAARYYGMLGSNAGIDELLAFADACQLSGDTAKSVSALEQLRTRKLKMSLQLNVCLMLADAYQSAGRDKDAIGALNEASTIPGGKNPDVFYRRALLTQKSNPVGAIKLYEENCKNYPADYRNFLQLGVLLSENKETLSKSIDNLKRVTELATTVPVVWLELGKVYIKIGKDSEALNAFRKYAETDPQNPEVNKQMGILLLKSGNVNEALVYLEIANTVQPNDPITMANLGKGYFNTGRNADAMDLLLKVRDKAKNNPEIRYELFELFTKSGQKDKALLEIKEVVEFTHDPKYIVIYAKCLLDDGKIKEAQDELENILAADAENVDALMLKALTLRTEKKYAEAIEIYKEVSYIKPEFASGFYERAETYLLQNKVQWAETFYKRTLEVDPKFALSELGLAKIAKMRKDSAGYKLHMESALKIDPNNAQIKVEYAKVND